MSERNEAMLPPQWQKITDYSLRLSWLHNQPKPSHLEMEKMMQEEGKEVSLEIIGHPGWWQHANIFMASFDTLEDALAAAKSTLKNSDFTPFGLLEDAPSSAPVKLSKSQRIKLIDEIMHEPVVKHAELVREAFLQEGDYALSVWIEELSFREDFEADFETPENPLRSFVGEIATAHTAPLVEADDENELDLGDFESDDDPDMEDLSEEEMIEVLGNFEKMKDINARGLDDADWQEVAKGVVKIEGNTLFVGDWQCVVPNDAEIYGAAFDSASFDLKEKGLSILIEMENKDE
jgi:hypothetical protein